MSRNTLPLALLIAGLAAAPANAQTAWPNWYVGLNGSMNFVDDLDVDGDASGEIETDTGFSYGASIGYVPRTNIAPLNNMRIEAEARRQENDIDRAPLSPASTPGNGGVDVTSYMANVFYDFRNESRWTPYLGAGTGIAEIELDDAGVLGVESDDDNVWAYQLMAGVGYSPVSLPNTEWSVGYRFFDSADPSFSQVGPLAGTAGLDVDSPQSHQIEVGAKFRF